MSERQELEAAIAALEAQRAVLGDKVVDAALGPLRAQLERMQGSDPQRQFVTILITDIVGSTKIGQGLEPEENLEILDGALQRMVMPIEQYGGRVLRFQGDGIKAVFGDPNVHENDAEMAVRAGLGILAVAQDYASELEAEWHISGFNVRVGVNTGWVAKDPGGTEGEDTFKGLTVNLAARLQDAAPVGGLLIAEYTYQQVCGLFEIEPLDPIEAKGFPEMVNVYLVKRVEAGTLQSHSRGIPGLQSPMIGRETELKRLKDAFYTAVEDNECQQVTIFGEAGIGKSRLLCEFQQWLDMQPHDMRLFQGRGREGTANSPYTLLKDVFSYLFEIKDSDHISIVSEKIEAGFGEYLGEDENGQMRAHLIGQLLGFDFSSSPYLSGVLGDAQQLRERALNYLGEYFQEVTNRSPLVIFLEDVHWADDSSLDAINQIVQKNRNKPLLLVCLARPTLLERRPYWGEGQSCHTRFTLQSLSKRESRELVEELLKVVAELPLILRELVVSGAEGNPYFIEELIKSLIDSGIIFREETEWRVDATNLSSIQLPSTLTAVLQTRLSNLPVDEYDTLQRAAVVGNVFWDGALQFIEDSVPDKALTTDRDLSVILESLHQRQLIFLRETSAFVRSREFTFCHNILRDVTYQGVLKRKRQRNHLLTAEWLIVHSGERADENPSLIADHFEKAGEGARAATYLRKAGERAFQQYAHQEALDYLIRAFTLCPDQDHAEKFAILLSRIQVYRLQGNRTAQEKDLESLAALVDIIDDDRKRAELAIAQALYARQTSNYPSIVVNAQKAIELGEANELPHLVVQGNLLWGRALLSQGDYLEAEPKFNQALELARQGGLGQFEADSLRNLGMVAENRGELQEAIREYEQSLELYRKIGDRRGEGRALNNLGNLFMREGDPESGMAYYDKFHVICREIGDRWGEGIVIRNIADAYLSQADFSEAFELLQEAQEIVGSVGNVTLEVDVLVGLGKIMIQRLEFERAKACFDQSLRIAHSVGNKPAERKTLLQIGRLFHHQGDYIRARHYYEQSLQSSLDCRDRSGEIQAMAYLGLLYHHLGEKTTSREYAQKAFNLAEESGRRTTLALAAIQLGYACAGSGYLSEASEAFQLALDLRQESDQSSLILEPKVGLAWVDLLRGDLPQAKGRIEEILSLVDKETLAGTDDPFGIYLTCYRILQACGDPRASQLLENAYQDLQEQAAKIEDEELRHSFLNNVATHREIMQEYNQPQ